LLNRVRLAATLFWSYLLIWTALLLVPHPARIFFLPEEAPEQLARWFPVDEAVHVSGYFLLMLLAAAAFKSISAGVGIAWLLVGGAAHGALSELAQLAIPPREGHWSDFGIDLIGLALGALIWGLFRRLGPTRNGSKHKAQP